MNVLSIYHSGCAELGRVGSWKSIVLQGYGVGVLGALLIVKKKESSLQLFWVVLAKLMFACTCFVNLCLHGMCFVGSTDWWLPFQSQTRSSCACRGWYMLMSLHIACRGCRCFACHRALLWPQQVSVAQCMRLSHSGPLFRAFLWV